MWHNSRRGFNLIRKRASARNNKQKIIQLSIIVFFILTISVFSIYGIYKVSNKKIIEVANKNVEENADVNIYEEVAVNIDDGENQKENNNKIVENELDEVVENTEQKINETREGMKITALGEIMMGSRDYTQNSYALAFKEVSSLTQDSDYVVSSLATNITSVEDLSDTKSKYIVNESIVNAFSALNIDGLNIATDHMLDFSKTMFTNTIDTLRKNDIDVIGMENDIAYAESNGIRVAFIGVNNVIIGNTKQYIDAGIFVYDLNKVKSSIKEAKTKADLVIVMTHYGKENTHQVTDVMRWFAREIVNAGADMVLGGHSLGIYPIEEYNGKIIIYSLGYLMHDTTNEYGKKSAVFDININKEGVIESLEITPTYIENKSTSRIYKDININMCNALLEELNSKSKLEKFTSTVENNKLIVKLK